MKCAPPGTADCTMGVPEVTKPIGEWLRAGFVPVRGQKLSAAEQAQPASLLQPEGIYGSGIPHDEELLRDQGIQFLRSVRAVSSAILPTACKTPLPFSDNRGRHRRSCAPRTSKPCSGI